MTIRQKWALACGFLLACLIGIAIWWSRRPSDPVYQGKRLSEWAAAVNALGRLDTIVNGGRPQVLAIRAIGTNAIPWLLYEMRKPPPLRSRLNGVLEKQSFIKYRFAIPAGADDLHQYRARCGFWALGEIAAPAIPDLVNMTARQPEFVPSALAGIGAPALNALYDCLTNIPTNISKTDPRATLAANTIGSLFVAVDVGRISRADAAFLLPPIQAWAKQANRHPAYWADAFIREFEHEKAKP